MTSWLYRLILPDKAFRWERPSLSAAYADHILRRVYLPAIREQLNQPCLFERLMK